jgi:hypothetical protein
MPGAHCEGSIQTPLSEPMQFVFTFPQIVVSERALSFSQKIRVREIPNLMTLLVRNCSNTPDVIPPATSDENGRKATLMKKGTKMCPNASLSARSVAFQQKFVDCFLLLTNVPLFVETSVQRIGV